MHDIAVVVIVIVVVVVDVGFVVAIMSFNKNKILNHL